MGDMAYMAYMADNEGSEEETPHTMETWPVVRGPEALWLLAVKNSLAAHGYLLRDMTAAANFNKALTDLRFGYKEYSLSWTADIIYRIYSSLSEVPLQAPGTEANMLMHHAINMCIARQDIRTTEEHGVVFLKGISILNMLHKLTEEDEPPARQSARLYMWRIAPAVRKWMYDVFWKTDGELV